MEHLLAEWPQDPTATQRRQLALNARMVQKNETELVAAKLAARLGLEHLWAVDDHTASWHSPAGETRNLRMVGHIRKALGREPSTRMLTLVGASRKGYYEAYLDQMHDVHVVSTDIVLR